MKYLNIILLILIATFHLQFFSFNSSAQSVGINTTGDAADPSALLDLNAPDKGFLITRADTANIASPAFGLMTLAPIDSCLYLYNGISWMGMGGAGAECICSSSSGGESPSKCGSPFEDSRDNQTYGTVEIGNQCWMSENLNYTPSSGSFWCYNNDPAQCDIYGRLYDWAIASNGVSSNTNPSGVQGICPDDWHLPSDEEWKELEMALSNMSQTEANNIGWRGTNEGDQLRASSFGGTNSSGFTALGGGHRNTQGNFVNIVWRGYFWSATESGSEAWGRTLMNGWSGVHRNTNEKVHGLSVRCVKN